LTVKLVVLLAVPPGVVTEIFAVTAPVGTVAVICVSEFTVKVAATVPNFTAVACVKLVPVIVTTVPTGPLVGLKVFTEGVILKFNAESRLPPGSFTVIAPVVAPDVIFAVANVSLTIVSVPVPVPNCTPVAVLNPWPNRPTEELTLAEWSTTG
jgi:hypothetical protein